MLWWNGCSEEGGCRPSTPPGAAPGELPDHLELPPEGVLDAVEHLKSVEVLDAGEHARAVKRARVAVVVHDLQEVEVVGLQVAEVGPDRFRAGDGVGAEVVPEGDGRPVRRLPA